MLEHISNTASNTQYYSIHFPLDITYSPLLRTLMAEYPVLWLTSVTVQLYSVDTSVTVTTIVLLVSSKGNHLYSGLVALTASQVSEISAFSHTKLSVNVTLDVMFTCRSLDDATNVTIEKNKLT